MEPLITASQLCFSYRQDAVLTNISFEVMPGEFIGIIGPNGGGKTTLLKLIMGFLTPKKGQIRVFNLPPSSSRTQLAYVPQNLRFDRQFPISVIELVLSGLLSKLPWYGIYSRNDYKMSYEALERVGMLSFKDHAFGTLSGGQAQRALIARALVSQPKLLLLDEPTASVDAQAEVDIYNILRDLSGSMTILMVTHDLRAAVHLVNRVLCVQNGVISMLPQEVCEHFAMGLYHAPIQLESLKQI